MLISKEDVYKLKYGDVVRCIDKTYATIDILVDYIEDGFICGRVYNNTILKFNYCKTEIENYKWFRKIVAGLSIHTIDNDIDQFGLVFPSIDYICCHKTNLPLIKISITAEDYMENFINIISKKRVNLIFNYDNRIISYKNMYCIEKTPSRSNGNWFKYDLTFRLPWEEQEIKDDFQSKMRDWLV